MVKVKTDHKWKQFKYRNEVPEKVLKDQFEHLDAEEQDDQFFCYRGWWYHVSDFMSGKLTDITGDWDGYHSDSYFSGVLLKLSKDGEEYRVGTYIS